MLNCEIRYILSREQLGKLLHLSGKELDNAILDLLTAEEMEETSYEL